MKRYFKIERTVPRHTDNVHIRKGVENEISKFSSPTCPDGLSGENGSLQSCNRKIIGGSSPSLFSKNGTVAEWLGTELQPLLRWFDPIQYLR